jgi:hypothetical protein
VITGKQGSAARSAHLPDLLAKKSFHNQLADLRMQLLDLMLAEFLGIPPNPRVKRRAAGSSSCFFQA